MSHEIGKLLRIFVGEDDQFEGMPLYEWIVQEARKCGLAGATALRGIEGYGTHSRVHTTKILRISTDLPVVVEIVDKPEKVQEFIERLEGVIEEGLATLEQVEMIRF